MDALMKAMCRCTRWENTHLPLLWCAPLDLLKGHAMLYDEGSVSIANTAVMYMQRAQLLLSTILVCDWLVLAFHLSLAMSILSSRDLLLMQIQSVLFTLAFSPVERVDPHVKRSIG